MAFTSREYMMLTRRDVRYWREADTEERLLIENWGIITRYHWSRLNKKYRTEILRKNITKDRVFAGIRTTYSIYLSSLHQRLDRAIKRVEKSRDAEILRIKKRIITPIISVSISIVILVSVISLLRYIF